VDSNAKGCIAEYKFGIECLKRDIKVSYPLIHSSLYDCVADTGENIYRIQIKSTTQDFAKHRKTIHIAWHHAYKKKDVDFFAVWVEKFKGFFIFKNDGVRMSIRLSLTNNNSIFFNNFDFK
tara:strand:- start:20 stop:382 length:363 start_codon:yes stop_codon:yes gene_type:complete